MDLSIVAPNFSCPEAGNSVHVNQLHVMMQTKELETLLLYSMYLVYIHNLL